MLALLVACSALMAVGLDAPPADAHLAYQEARAKAGRSPDDQVKLALWCEAHGLTAERLHHLTLAVLADPKHAAARGLLGLVAYNGRWLRPEVLAEKLQADKDHAAALKEYQAKRLKAAYTADAQWALGVWCDEHGLKDQAKAHITAVTRLDPARENAWKRLGYKKHEGRWVTDAHLAAEKVEAETQKAANKRWKTILEKYKTMLGHASQREEAEAALAEVTDPRAVPSIGRVFAAAEATQAKAVQLLGQIDSASASKALAFLAVFAQSAEARRTATETLRGRDPREYAGLLISLIRDPIKFEVRPVGGPGSPGILYVEGKKANFKRMYTAAAPSLMPGDRLDYDPQYGPVVIRNLGNSSTGLIPAGMLGGMLHGYQGMTSSEQQLDGFLTTHGLGANGAKMGHAVAESLMNQNLNSPEAEIVQGSVASMPLRPTTRFSFTYANQAEIPVAQFEAEARRSTVAARQQLANDVAVLERINKDASESTARIVGVLNAATGQKLDSKRETWRKWWIDQLGYRFNAMTDENKPTFVDTAPMAYSPQAAPVATSTQLIGFNRMSCFGAGTPVRTINGIRPIESLRVGDQVLTQSTSTGALGYRPILVVHHNPPSATFRIQLKGEPIISSHFHRFWISGKGWKMARDLKPGDPVRTLGGIAPVESVEADKVQLVYNLDIADDADFFAGQLGALVHDNTLPDPRLVPFDAAPVPVAEARQTR